MALSIRLFRDAVPSGAGSSTRAQNLGQDLRQQSAGIPLMEVQLAMQGGLRQEGWRAKPP